MKRTFSRVFLVAFPLLQAACSEPEVVVQAELTQEGAAAPEPVADIPVRLLPYDRDALIDSLTSAARQPEPQIPPNLAQQRDTLRQLQEAWRQTGARLQAIEDTVRTLTVQVRPGQDAVAERERKQRQAERLGQARSEVKQRLDSLQARIAILSRANQQRMDSVRVARRQWSQTAMKDFDKLVERRLTAAGRGEVVDTTGRAGTATFRVEEGRWWVYARYALPTEELYWNFPVEVTGDRTLVQLTEQNAKRRPLF